VSPSCQSEVIWTRAFVSFPAASDTIILCCEPIDKDANHNEML